MATRSYIADDANFRGIRVGHCQLFTKTYCCLHSPDLIKHFSVNSYIGFYLIIRHFGTIQKIHLIHELDPHSILSSLYKYS